MLQTVRDKRQSKFALLEKFLKRKLLQMLSFQKEPRQRLSALKVNMKATMYKNF